MGSVNAPSQPLAARVIGVLVVFDTIALLFAGIVHLVGIYLSVGNFVFDEPALLPAGIVETLAGLLFVWAAFTLFTKSARAWIATLIAHLFAIAGFLLGLYATRDGTTLFNGDYHRVMLVIFIVGLALLFAPNVRGAPSRSDAVD